MNNANFTPLTDRNKNNHNIFEHLLNNSSESDKCEKKNWQKSFHEIIEMDKKILINLYSNKPLFKEILPQIKKSSRGTPFYHSIIKKDIKKTNFFKDILNKIEELNTEKNKRRKTNLYKKKQINFNINELEKIKNKKIKFIRNDSLRQSSLTNRNNSYINRKISINESPNNIINKNNNDHNNIKIYKNIKNHFIENDKIKKLNKSNSEKSIFKLNRLEKFNNILKMCKGEIKTGQKVGKKFEVYNNKISEDIKDIIQKESKENKNLQDQQLIEKEMTDDNNKDKYKIKEVEKFNDIKKRIDSKISDIYAYFNRKEFRKKIKDKEKNDAYELYLKDINQINQKLEENKKVEKKTINKVKELLEDVYKGKEYLENKISEYNEKYQDLKDFDDNNFQNNLENDEQKISENSGFDLFEPPPNIKIKDKKVILPKLFLRKKNFE